MPPFPADELGLAPLPLQHRGLCRDGVLGADVGVYAHLPAPRRRPTGERRPWTGAIAAIAGALGLPLLPFWSALADRYARQPIIVRSFGAHMFAGALCILAGNV